MSDTPDICQIFAHREKLSDSWVVLYKISTGSCTSTSLDFTEKIRIEYCTITGLNDILDEPWASQLPGIHTLYR